MQQESKETTSSKSRSWRELLIPILPSLLWAIVVVIALTMFHEQIGSYLSRTNKITAFGATLEATERAIDKSAARIEKIPEIGDHLRLVGDGPLRKSLIARWSQMDMSGRKLRILLIHDHLKVAQALRTPFTDLGFTVDLGICGSEAESLLKRHEYDVVISDNKWEKCSSKENSESAGVNFLRYAHDQGFAQPTIFYIEHLNISRGTPAYAAGITNNWYEVLHLVLDVISRHEQLKPESKGSAS